MLQKMLQGSCQGTYGSFLFASHAGVDLALTSSRLARESSLKDLQ